jgi:Leucine-rich repeat (LRR) protein
MTVLSRTCLTSTRKSTPSTSYESDVSSQQKCSATILKTLSLKMQFDQLGRLYLKFQSLDRLPDEISLLVNLEVLVVSDNNITEITPSINCLRKLCSFHCKNNKLVKLPDMNYNLPMLRHIDCSENRLSSLPDDLQNCGDLAYLDISDNSFSTLPPTILKLNNLSRLHAQDNNIKKLPNELIKLLKLQLFTLSIGKLNKPLPFCLKYLPLSYEDKDQLHRMIPYRDSTSPWYVKEKEEVDAILSTYADDLAKRKEMIVIFQAVGNKASVQNLCLSIISWTCKYSDKDIKVCYIPNISTYRQYVEETRKQQKPVPLAIIYAHGLPKLIQLSPISHFRIGDIQKSDFDFVMPHGKIMLLSCHGGDRLSMAHAISYKVKDRCVFGFDGPAWAALCLNNYYNSVNISAGYSVPEPRFVYRKKQDKLLPLVFAMPSIGNTQSKAYTNCYWNGRLVYRYVSQYCGKVMKLCKHTISQDKIPPRTLTDLDSMPLPLFNNKWC